MTTTALTLRIPTDLHARLTEQTGMNPADLAFALLLVFDRKMVKTPPPPKIPVGEPDQDKVEHLFSIARDKVGEGWVNWNRLRPAYRDRESYEAWVWERVLDDPDLETHEEEHGSRLRRQVRHRPLV